MDANIAHRRERMAGTSNIWNLRDQSVEQLRNSKHLDFDDSQIGQLSNTRVHLQPPKQGGSLSFWVLYETKPALAHREECLDSL